MVVGDFCVCSGTQPQGLILVKYLPQIRAALAFHVFHGIIKHIKSYEIHSNDNQASRNSDIPQSFFCQKQLSSKVSPLPEFPDMLTEDFEACTEAA